MMLIEIMIALIVGIIAYQVIAAWNSKYSPAAHQKKELEDEARRAKETAERELSQ